MMIVGMVLAGLYAVGGTALALSASADAAKPAPPEDAANKIDCSASGTQTTSVSQPNTIVTVTCPKDSTVEPSALTTPKKDVYLDANCTNAGVLSSVCPGATVALAKAIQATEAVVTNVSFPQLPASEQVVCLKCKLTASGECKAVITVAAALPQGPQACAVPGTSVRLQVNEAGGSAQFACGNNMDLEPTEATTAYADDCTRKETLKDMTRSAGPDNYVTLKVHKLKKKTLCYLCKQRAAAANTGGEGDRCTVYVEVSGGAQLSPSAGLGAALACAASMLRFL